MQTSLYPRLPWNYGDVLTPPWRGAEGPRVLPAWRLDDREGVIRSYEEEGDWAVAWRPARPVWSTPHGVWEFGADVSGPPAFCAVCPEPDVLWGECDSDHRPTLEGETPPTSDDVSTQLIETTEISVRLFLREDRGRCHFMAVICRDQADHGVTLWEKYQERQPADFLIEALSPYTEFARRQVSTDEEDFKRIERVVARMIRELRTGRDPRRLMRIALDAPEPRMHCAEIFDLARAWSEVRVDIAQELIRTVTSAQTPDGYLPAFYDENGHPSKQTLDRPGLAATTLAVWRRSADREWYDEVAPRVVHYVTALALSMDPDLRGDPRWLRAEDALVPPLFDPQVRSPDVFALLIREIQALEELAGAVAVRSIILGELPGYKEVLLQRLRSEFWSAETQTFIEKTLDGRPVLRKSIACLMPLGCDGLTHEQERALLDLLIRRDYLFSERGVLAWADSESVASGPVLPEHQVLLLEFLDARRATAERSALRNALLANLPEGHTPAEQALILALLAFPSTSRLQVRLISPALIWMNRHQKAILAAAILLFLLLNLAVVRYYSFRENFLTLQTLETTLGLARRLYADGRYEEAETYMRVILESRMPHPTAWIEMGNIQYRLGRLDEAAYWYQQQEGTNPVAARARHNLAVVRYEQGRIDEALQIWAENATNYDIIAPPVSQRALSAIKILKGNEM